MLEYLITSKAKRNLLKLFITNPDKAFYTREVAKLTKEPLNAARRELANLEKEGLVKSHRTGNLTILFLGERIPVLSGIEENHLWYCRSRGLIDLQTSHLRKSSGWFFFSQSVTVSRSVFARANISSAS